MPMRIEVSSGAGSAPCAADAVDAAVGAVDGVVVPPPQATARSPTAMTSPASFINNPPPTRRRARPLTRAKCKPCQIHRLHFRPNQMRSADANGHPIAYELDGSGTPLVLIAGTGYPGATWPPELVSALAKHHAVLTFDHRGTGTTPPSPEPYTTRLFAAD